MYNKNTILVLAALLLLATTTMAGVAPLALPYAVAPFGSSYTAHSINHALAAPVAVPAAAPVAVPAAASLIAAAPAVYAPHVAAPAAYFG
ncbi:angiomotin-like [Periplaneta americana]|uniref:angiomotin-like n=1 Tax=Periplaneta americana TaxID=6978 RepID=UPI0037E90178